MVAWADAFIPVQAWIEFHPTNRIVAGRSLIRVGTTQTPQQASPIYGSFEGDPSSLIKLLVGVEIAKVMKGNQDLLM